jgi:alpha-beta hydrolase superfamily lysophospholipase
VIRRAFLALLLLAACSGTPGGPMPSDPGIARGGTRDAPLAIHEWPSQGPPRAIILGLHGFGDTGELAFGLPARYWNGRGIAVYAIDQRGFGANPSRKRWPGIDALVADAVRTARDVRRRHPGVPLIVVGHSMGGGVALAAAAAGMDADALVLVGPAIAGGDALNPFARAGAWALAAALPDQRWTGEGLIEIQPTDNPEAIRRVLADPRHFGDPSSRELYGLVLLMDRAAAAAPRVRVPVLTLMGERDEVLRPAQVRRIHDRIPGAAGFVDYPDGWHWLLADLQAARVWGDIADFALSAGGIRLNRTGLP